MIGKKFRWRRIHDTLRALVRQKSGKHKHPTAASPEFQSVKCTHIKGTRGVDNGKKVNGRKRHLLVDTQVLLLEVRVKSADVSDPAGAKLVFGQRAGSCKKLRIVWVDGTYRGKLLDWVKQRFKFRIQPV